MELKKLEDKKQELEDILETPHLVRRWGEGNIRECLANCNKDIEYLNQIQSLQEQVKKLEEEKDET